MAMHGEISQWCTATTASVPRFVPHIARWDNSDEAPVGMRARANMFTKLRREDYASLADGTNTHNQHNRATVQAVAMTLINDQIGTPNE